MAHIFTGLKRMRDIWNRSGPNLKLGDNTLQSQTKSNKCKDKDI